MIDNYAPYKLGRLMAWKMSIDLCVKFVKPFIFIGIHRVKTGLFYKSI